MKQKENARAAGAKKRGKARRILLLLASLALLVVLAANSLAYVPPGCVGVVETFGAIEGQTLGNGLHLKLPFVRSVQNINNRIRKLDVMASAASKELQAVNMYVSVNYNIRADEVARFMRDIGVSEFDYNILHPVVQECVKSVTARHTVDSLVAQSEEVNEEIAALVESKVEQFGIEVMSFNVTELAFSEAFRTAIEEKQVAQQALLSSKAKADATIALAQARAEANRLLGESLTPGLSAYYLESKKIQKWDGVLPRVSGGGAIVDFRNP